MAHVVGLHWCDLIFLSFFRITASPTADHDGHISREIGSSPETSPESEEVVYTMGNETETSDLEKSQSEGSIRSIRSPSILSSRRTKTPFEVVEIVIGNGIKISWKLFQMIPEDPSKRWP